MRARLATRRSLGLVGLGMLLGAVVAFPAAVIAIHQFSDVPDSSIYHNDIDAIADAGVTTGCGNGTTYCPGDYVTREQMAAFMNRLGALAPGKTPVVNATKLDGLNSTQFLRSDTSADGTFTCAGPAMTPSAPNHATGSFSAYSNTATDTVFRCTIEVPDGATITAVHFFVNDTSASESVACVLYRYYANFLSSTYSFDYMAQATTSAAQASGFYNLSDSIDEPLVDNDVYWYVAQCTPSGTSTSTAVVGVRVHFTVTGLPLP